MSDSAADLTARVIEVAADTFGVSPASLTTASSADSVEAWDSITHLNLMLSVEQTFDAAIPPERMSELTSIEKLVAEIRRLKAS